jgi:hypothetical protein
MKIRAGSGDDRSWRLGEARITTKMLLPFLCAIMLLTQSSCMLRSFQESAPESPIIMTGYGTLNKVPFREAWYGLYFQEDPVGYSHFKIEPSGENFRVTTDSLMRLTALKKTNETELREEALVRPDLTMISFESRVRENDKNLELKGRTEGNRFVLDIMVEGEKRTREGPLEGKIYHSSAVSLMPAIRGLKDGNGYSFAVFNKEKLAVETVQQQISSVKGSPGPNEAVWRVKNIFGRSGEVQSWLNKQGLTVLEKGSLITILEDEATAKSFLDKKASGKDMILDVSRVRVAKPIPKPEALRFLKIRMEGVDPSLIANDHRQEVIAASEAPTSKGFFVIVNTEDLRKLRDGSVRPSEPFAQEHLASTVFIEADHKEIADQSSKIATQRDSDLEKVTKLVNWTAENIKKEMKESFSALSVLRSREGECQSHANLYTALARSSKIPTRVCTGLVYTNGVGFLYHAWAESYVNGWLAVDPTLKQVPADATHIKIAAQDATEESRTVLKMVGKVKIDVAEYK